MCIYISARKCFAKISTRKRFAFSRKIAHTRVFIVLKMCARSVLYLLKMCALNYETEP